MHLVGFIIRMYHDARSFECQIFRGVWQRLPQPINGPRTETVRKLWG